MEEEDEVNSTSSVSVTVSPMVAAVVSAPLVMVDWLALRVSRILGLHAG